MSDQKWGHCKECKFFGSPARRPLGGEEAACLQPELKKFSLTVYGACGCSAWELRTGIEQGAEQPTPPA